MAATGVVEVAEVYSAVNAVLARVNLFLPENYRFALEQASRSKQVAIEKIVQSLIDSNELSREKFLKPLID